MRSIENLINLVECFVPMFDGKGDYVKSDFKRFAKNCKELMDSAFHGEKQVLVKLIRTRIQGPAYSEIDVRNSETFQQIMSTLTRVYGPQRDAHDIIYDIRNCRQYATETTEEFIDRFAGTYREGMSDMRFKYPEDAAMEKMFEYEATDALIYGMKDSTIQMHLLLTGTEPVEDMIYRAETLLRRIRSYNERHAVYKQISDGLGMSTISGLRKSNDFEFENEYQPSREYEQSAVHAHCEYKYEQAYQDSHHRSQRHYYSNLSGNCQRRFDTNRLYSRAERGPSNNKSSGTFTKRQPAKHGNHRSKNCYEPARKLRRNEQYANFEVHNESKSNGSHCYYIGNDAKRPWMGHDETIPCDYRSCDGSPKSSEIEHAPVYVEAGNDCETSSLENVNQQQSGEKRVTENNVEPCEPQMESNGCRVNIEKQSDVMEPFTIRETETVTDKQLVFWDFVRKVAEIYPDGLPEGYECINEFSESANDESDNQVFEIESGEKRFEHDPSESEASIYLKSRDKKSSWPMGVFGSLSKTRRGSALLEGNIVNEGMVVKLMNDHEFFRMGELNEIMPFFNISVTDFTPIEGRPLGRNLTLCIGEISNENESMFSFEQRTLANNEFTFQCMKNIEGNVLTRIDIPKCHETSIRMRQFASNSDGTLDKFSKRMDLTIGDEDEVSTVNEIEMGVEMVNKDPMINHRILHRHTSGGVKNGYGLASNEQPHFADDVLRKVYYSTVNKENNVVNFLRDGIPWYVRKKRVRYRSCA